MSTTDTQALMERIDKAIKDHADPATLHKDFAAAIFPEKDQQTAVIRAHEYRRGQKRPVAFDVVSRIIAWATKHAKPSRQREKTKQPKAK